MLLMNPALAEISESGEHGFTVTHSITTEREPFVVYRTMTSHIDQWWNGGRVEHLRIIYFSPCSELRFDGALGPLQTMAVQGRMTWKIEAVENGSKVSFTYSVFGHPEGGLAGIAPAVDGVIGEQLARLGERLNRD